MQRSVQEKEAEIKALKDQLAGMNPSESKDLISLDDLKSNPLGTLMKNGVTYSQGKSCRTGRDPPCPMHQPRNQRSSAACVAYNIFR